MDIILGAAVSLIVQYVKTNMNLGGAKTMFALLIVSIVGAGVYTALVDVGLWDQVARMLVTAGAFYAFVIQRFETK